MRAVASLVAGVCPTTRRTRCTTLRSAPPLTLRATGDGTVHVVGSAAGPVGGDDLHLSLTVGDGARLTVRSVAAALVLPGAKAAPSSLTVDVSVGEGAALRWLPEPTIVVRGSDHRARTSIALAAGAELVWREVVVLGRHAEAAGSLLQRLRVDRAGRPLLRTDLAVGPRWPGSLGPGGVGTAGAVATALVVGPSADRLPRPGDRAAAVPPGDGVRAAVLPLAEEAALVSALAPRALDAATALDTVLDAAFDGAPGTALDAPPGADPAALVHDG